MSEKVYKKLVAEYRRKDRLYPDRGFSVRPWEQSLRESIMNEIEAGLARGAACLCKAAASFCPTTRRPGTFSARSNTTTA